ncbi:MAG: PEP-CTERM sorting domain-containing protein [Pirellulaceae bacterium]
MSLLRLAAGTFGGLGARGVAAAFFAVAVGLASTASAQQLGINFGADEPNGARSDVTGVAGVNGTATWNNLDGATGAATNLVNATGAATGVNVTWSSPNTWASTGRGEEFNTAPAGNDRNLMTGYLDTAGAGGQGVVIDVTGVNSLSAGARSVVLYMKGGIMDRSGFYTVNGQTQHHVDAAPFSGSYVLGEFGDYLVFNNITGDTINITSAADNTRAPINAIEIVTGSLADPVMSLTVNRDTGAVQLHNNTTAPVQIDGLSILSPAGTLNVGNWNAINRTGDADSGGSVDASNVWHEFSAKDTDLSEGTLGTLTVGIGATVNLGNAWDKYFDEDVQLQYQLAGTGEIVNGIVAFQGNNDMAYVEGDLNFDNAINALDWDTYIANAPSDVSALSGAGAYARGDLNGDGLNNIQDLNQFITLYDAANGAGAFQAMVSSVPEPASAAMFGAMAVFAFSVFRRRVKQMAAVAVAVTVIATTTAASAQQLGINFGADEPNGGRSDVTGVAGVAYTANWNNLDLATGTATGLVNADGVATGVSVTWSSPNTWSSTGRGENFNNAPAGNDRNLMTGYLDTLGAGDTGVTIDVAGLNTLSSGPRSVIVYVKGGVANRSGFYTIGADTQHLVQASPFSGFYEFGPNGDYLVFNNITGDSFQLTSAADNVRAPINAIEIFTGTFDPASYDPFLTLEVNSITGAAKLINKGGSTIDINGYEIASPNGALRVANWNSLQDQNVDAIGAGSGQHWTQGGTSSANGVVEGFLLGSTTFSPSTEFSLGSVYAPNIGDANLEFTYSIVGGQTVSGHIEFVTTGGVPGDYNKNGTVDAADYTVWKDNFGSSTNLDADGNGNGTIDAADYTVWKDNFGLSGAAGAISSVPEPASASLFLLLGGIMAAVVRRTRRAALAAACVAVVATQAQAAVTQERVYSLGDDSQEGAAVNAVLGSASAAPGFTLDSVGPSGAFVDLQVNGSPTYVSVSDRPGVTGAAPKGASFGGNDYLYTQVSMNAPAQMEGNFFPGGYPVDYASIFSHGIQMWAKPNAATQNVRQELISDTQEHGIYISDTNTWGLQFDNVSITSTTPVAFGQWTHVMELAGFTSRVSGNTATGGALWVNGVAVAANGGAYDPSADPLTVGALLQDPLSLTPSNFYHGILDDVNMFLWGDNGTRDFGTLNLGTDNAFIAAQMAGIPDGDANLDGKVDDADISAFAAQWGSRNLVNGVQVGDLNTRRNNADFNYDGRTDFGDWYILRANHPNGGSLDLATVLGSSVPEPSSLVLVLGSVLALLRVRRK